MKLLCIRNFFTGTSDLSVRWTKGEYYKAYYPNDLERENGVVFFVETNFEMEHYIKQSNYDKYFKSVEDSRDDKLEQILN